MFILFILYEKWDIEIVIFFFRKLHSLNYQLLNMSHQTLCQDIFLGKSCEGNGIPETG